METLRDLFILNNDYSITISISDNYCLYIEGVDINYCNMTCLPFDINKIYYLTIELNDYYGNMYQTIQYELENISLDMTCDELKEKVFDLMIEKAYKSEVK